MKRCFLSWLVLYSLVVPVAAQSLQQDQMVLVRELTTQFRQDSVRAAAIAAEQGFSLYTVDQGTITGFAGFSETGMLLFNTTTNAGAGRTIGVHQVWPGGTAGTSLTGILSGNRLGIWDGGGVRTTHREFGGRVTQADNATGDQQHPTHVAGTMMAAGVDPSAKGMAYQAELRAYDWNNDEAEMIAAGTAGMLVSNHSYGQASGWNYSSGAWRWYGDVTISTVEDYSYGFYSRRAEAWDRVAVNNPYYLICKAAGNDRGKSHSGSHLVMINNSWQTSTAPRNDIGPYDCIATYAIAKNILTVGAVRKNESGWTQPSDVEMTSFSGWGPADDGRIKPDVVAPGQNVRSATDGSDFEYNLFNGTSMATPVVSGALFLLQQQYYGIHNRFMRSATLKGLAIHTTDEAGSAPGPDYQFGWGQVNIPRAVAMIGENLPYTIQEQVLQNQQVFAQTYQADATQPVRVTITWIDPPGKPVEPALNPRDLMLINDLDIRLIRKSDSAIFSPYILNPAVPANPATTGDNFRDNVEQIFIATPQAGAYRLVVSHKGNLENGNDQAFSLMVSGLEPVAPVADFTVENITVCAGDPVHFTDVSQNDPNDWEWTIDTDSGVHTVNGSTTELSYDVPGTYTVEVTLKVANLGGADSVKRTVTVEVMARPADVTIDGSIASMVHREDVYMVPATAGSTYAWSVENGTIQSGNGTNEVRVKWGNFRSGRVAVQETNTASCTGDTAFLNVALEWATTVGDATLQLVNIYPNPASDLLSVAFHAPHAQQVKARITNLMGQTIQAESWDVSSGAVIRNMDISEISAGVYLFRLEGDFSPVIQKIMIR